MPTLTAVIEETFEAPGLPPGWYTDTPHPKYGAGAWDCRGGDGAIVQLGDDNWSSLRVEVELAAIGAAATAYVGTDARTALQLALGASPNARHHASEGSLLLERSATRAPIEEGNATLVFEWTAERMTASANGVTLLDAPNQRGSARAGTLQTAFRDCLVTRFAVFGEPFGEDSPPAEAIDKTYPLEVSVDFNDDLMACSWTHETFKSLFRELKTWGTARVSWIDLGREADGYFDCAPLKIDVHGQQTFRAVGDIFTAAVDHAHESGIELYGIFKPYDMAIMGITDPPFSEAAKTRGRIHRIGGSLGWSTRMAAANQHLIMARRPRDHGPALNEVWTRLDLVKEDDAETALSADDITLIVSDDNDHFRPYAGLLTRTEVIEDYPVYRTTPGGPRPSGETRRSRVFRLEFEIRAPFMAIMVNGAARSFSNRFQDLVHIFGPAGEETRLTYGLTPRRNNIANKFGETRITSGGELPGGFEYNRFPGAPSGGSNAGGEPMNSVVALDHGVPGTIALARGKDRGPGALMSPCFPETRALWMTWITAMLDAGADGIDLRPGNHHSDFAWSEYGFEEPVRDEMLRRTGVDIWETDDFDKELWWRIRGEGWTQFLREASTLVRSRGKKMIAHVDGHFDNPPGLPGPMGLVTDWRTWFEEDLLDAVTGKALWPYSSFAREVLEAAHARGIPVSYTPYCNNFFEDRRTTNHLGDSPEGCEMPVERLIELGREAGYDSFNFYECASALRAAPDGSVNFRPNASPLRAVMQRNFAS